MCVSITDRKYRTLEIFFRGICGEDLSPSKLAAEYELSTKSITRSINEIKSFLAGYGGRDGNATLSYSHATKAYRLLSDEFLSDGELYAAAKMIVESRAFSKDEVSRVLGKLRRFSAPVDREKTNRIVRDELDSYVEDEHDCDSVTDNMWRLANAITEKNEITIDYFKDNNKPSRKRVRPISLEFSDHSFFLVAYRAGRDGEPQRFRVDKITKITGHRKRFEI